jgi:ribosomal peptide maturation radical SAM protein 1
MSRVRLISMPWDQLEHPPIQLAILQAVLERDGIDAEVHCLGLDFLDHCMALTAGGPPGERLGVAEYDLVVELSRDVGLGDWIFAESTEDNDAGYVRWLREHPVAERSIEVARRFRALVPSFLDRWAETLAAAGPAVVGFTTGADQTAASLALARRLKARLPGVRIVFGGANCQGVMGAALHQAFPWVDAVVRGEGERVLPGLLKDLLAGGPCRPQPGLCYRDGERSVVVPEGGDPVALDDGPVPRYDAYFARLAASPAAAEIRPRVTLLYESARGCWWGARSHCTFCGISEQALAFRSKRPERVVQELLELTRRYDTPRVLVVDYILDRRYFREVLPHLRDAGAGLRMFCETKANITKADVRLLREAGFVSIQAGVESLSDPILKAMRKGVTAFQNVRLLKWCAEVGVKLFWNVLYGLPGEPPEEYARMADVMRSLVHLEPPRLVPLALDRFSPYQEQPEAFGLIPLGPRRDYGFIHPTLDAATLEALAYTFEYRHADGRQPAAYILALREVVEAWRASSETAFGSLRYRRHRRGLTVTDRRPGLPATEYRLGGAEAAAYLACEDGATLARVDATLHAAGLDLAAGALEGFLDECVAARLVHRDGQHYLALALPPSAGAARV